MQGCRSGHHLLFGLWCEIQDIDSHLDTHAIPPAAAINPSLNTTYFYSSIVHAHHSLCVFENKESNVGKCFSPNAKKRKVVLHVSRSGSVQIFLLKSYPFAPKYLCTVFVNQMVKFSLIYLFPRSFPRGSENTLAAKSSCQDLNPRNPY